MEQNVGGLMGESRPPAAPKSERGAMGGGEVSQGAADHDSRRCRELGVPQVRGREITGVINHRVEVDFEELFDVDRARAGLWPEARSLQCISPDPPKPRRDSSSGTGEQVPF